MVLGIRNGFLIELVSDWINIRYMIHLLHFVKDDAFIRAGYIQSVAAFCFWIYLRNALSDLPGLVREGDLYGDRYWEGDQKTND